MSTRLDGLTFARFVAAVVVVVYHFGKGSLPTRLLPGLCASGPQMVTFFFVLSGFVMVTAYAGRDDLSTRDYWQMRVARLIPVYLVALLLTWVLAPSVRSWPGLGLSLVLCQAWAPGWATTVNFPGWSLSVEAAFYAIFPLLLVAIRSPQITSWKWLFFAGACWATTQVAHLWLLNCSDLEPTLVHDLVGYFPLSHASSFMLGIAGAQLWRAGNIPQVPAWGLGLLLALVLLALESQAFLSQWTGWQWPFEAGWWGPLFLCVILALAVAQGRVAQWLAWPPLVLLGEASYSLYILHFPLYRLHQDWLVPWLGLHGAVVHYVYAGLLIGLSLAAYRWIESPCRRWLRPRCGAA